VLGYWGRRITNAIVTLTSTVGTLRSSRPVGLLGQGPLREQSGSRLRAKHPRSGATSRFAASTG
jgi:hypothetical protein